MRIRWAISVFAVACACGNKTEQEASGAFDRAMECADYQLAYWRGVAGADTETLSKPEPPDFDRYLCAELYSEASCPKAFAPDAESPEQALAPFATACAAAYCERLDEPKPLLCRRGPETLKPNDLVDAVVQLDRAVLSADIGNPDLAGQLAARFRLFRTMTASKSVSIDLPKATPGDQLTQTVLISIDARGAVTIDGELVDDDELAKTLKQARKRAPEATVTISAAQSVGYKKVVALMDQVKTAGFDRISLATPPAAPAPPPAP